MKNLCVCMIVKDEREVIERCLRSVLPLIDSWCIVDTGSTDDTKKIVRRVLNNIRGRLYEKMWKNFGHNKTEALRLAREHAEYALLIDADDVLELPENLKPPKLTADEYWLTIKYDTLEYRRPHIVRTSKPYEYKEPVHEYLYCAEPTTKDVLHDVVYRVVGGGARSKDPEKFLRDAEVLLDDLKENPDSLRSMFYLGQSYRDAGNHKEALKWYLTRAIHTEGWIEETYVALLEAAKSTEHLFHQKNAGIGEVVTAYLNAYENRPTRAEAPYWLARYLRFQNRRALAAVFAEIASNIQKPEGDNLFVESDVYEWKALDEFAISAFYIPDKKEAGRKACDTLSRMLLPENIQIHVKELAEWYTR